MNFRLTARDNRSPGAAVVDSDTTTVAVTDTARPFVVTSPNTAVSWTAASSETVTWNVAGTDEAPVSCADVDILLSTDGGASFPTTLLAATANDRSQSITVPDSPTTTTRLMIVFSTGIFFDVSNSDFSITPDGGGCLDDVVLTNDTVTGTEIFQAATSIAAGPNFAVADGGDATFRAGSQVLLRDGFSVATGGRFAAEINPGVCK